MRALICKSPTQGTLSTILHPPAYLASTLLPWTLFSSIPIFPLPSLCRTRFSFDPTMTLSHEVGILDRLTPCEAPSVHRYDLSQRIRSKSRSSSSVVVMVVVVVV